MRRGAWAGALGGAVVAGAAGAAGVAVAGRRRARARASSGLDDESSAGTDTTSTNTTSKQTSTNTTSTETASAGGTASSAEPSGAPTALPPWPEDPGAGVTTHDGLRLHAEVAGDPDAPLTMIFVHGYGLNRRSWRFQRRDLAHGDVRARLVFYDHRSHGASERSEAASCTIDQLGADLECVLEQLGGDRPVVLVGHSMGGMTVLALAERRPELFGGQVVGVALLATSAGQLSEVTLGLPRAAGVVLRRVRPHHLVGLSRGLPLVAALASPRSTLRRRSSSLTASVVSSVVHRFSFGGDVDPALVADVETMIGGTGVDVLAAFAPTFLDHDKLATLPVLEKLPVTILVGSADLMTPVEHARTLAAALPDAEVQVLPDVGHMVTTERPAVVARALRRLLERSAGHALAET